MEYEDRNPNDQESARTHQASIEIADALAKMFAELKPKIMAKYSLEDEQVILLAIAKAAVKLGTNTMPPGTLTPDQTETLERDALQRRVNFVWVHPAPAGAPGSVFDRARARG